MSINTLDSAAQKRLEYFNGDELAADVFLKYALRDEAGNLLEETPEQMHKRLAKEFARIEAKYPNPLSEEEIYSHLVNFSDIIPQGSPMSGVGNPHQIQSLSNCFVIDPPQDSYGGILYTDQEQAQIMKRRGGVGFDLSTIRPKGLPTKNAARTTDGIGVFMERFSNTCREVAQGGRRGALMLTISCNHPEIETFIDIKRDLKKVTGANISIRFTDEFMKAARDGSSYTLRWPVDADPSSAKITKTVNARDVWNKFVEAAWASAEPGALFWDTAVNNTPSDIYSKFGYNSVSTNPCVTGDTQIAVADGRGYVSIGELAASGVDVPVYAHDNDTGKVVVKTMRNPRLTGEKKPVYRVTIEGGHTFRATDNHTMILRDGSRKTVQELQPGDQLWIAQKTSAKFNEVLPGIRATQSQDYIWVRDCNSKSWKAEHRIIWEAHHGRKIALKEVIHHLDFNASNNSIDNLRLMSKDDHDAYHASLIRGENNPIFKIKADPKKFDKYSAKMSQSTSGLNNPRAYDISNEELMKHFEALIMSLGRRPSTGDWEKYAAQNSLPKFLNSYRLGGKNFSQVVSDLSDKLGISSELTSSDPRMAARALEAQESGYSWRISNNELKVERKCEWCETYFWNSYNKREISFCSHSCSNLYANRKAGKNLSRAATLQKIHEERGTKNRVEQLNVYTKLRFDLGRVPQCNEWANACKTNGLPFRLGTKNGFSTWEQLKSEAALYNHRVVSIEFAGHEDVFNGTVDDVHTLLFKVGQESVENLRNPVDLIIASEQCGEIVLSAYDSCRLLVLNLTSFVLDPFLPTAKFDYPRFFKVARKAQRLMDDLIDLEVECVDKILAKIDADPQPESVKAIEMNLWLKIKNACLNGRRTGLGITGLGDTLAGIGLVYGSPDSIVETEKIYKTMAVAAHTESCYLARERGAFPVFNYEMEKSHAYLGKVLEACGQEVVELWKTTGRRNISLTTTAPTGSVSILTGTTSGIEPAFLLSYKRRRKINPNDVATRVDFVDALGDKWVEYIVYHPWFKKWMDATGKTEAQDSPYWKATANDVNWVASADIQAAAQRWIDHSISKTVNLPNSATKELVSEVYMRAWELGCKGFTVYRDGCRTGVLVSTEEAPKKAEVSLRDAPKRPKSLSADIHKVSVKNDGEPESWLVIVGLSDGNPYEIFCGLSHHVEVPKRYKSGNIVKNGKVNGISTYNLVVPIGDGDNLVFRDVVNLFDNPTQGAFTRTISLALRHGVGLHWIVDQLQKDKSSDMFSFAKVIARVLKGYIKDGTKHASEKGCPQCGSNELVYQEGCLSCKQCGWGKC